MDEREVIVEDNGRGISADVLPRLFQCGAAFGEKNGQGLGLFSVRQILTDLGGQIHLESQVGARTKAILTLPLHSPDSFIARKKTNTANGFLMDMNHGNRAEQSGLNVMERAAIQSNAILVMNDFECTEVLERAARIAVPMFLKYLLARLAVAQLSIGRCRFSNWSSPESSRYRVSFHVFVCLRALAEPSFV